MSLSIPFRCCYFELDHRTEGVQEFLRKAERYSQVLDNSHVGFIFERETDMQLAQMDIPYPFISYSTLYNLSSHQVEAFAKLARQPLNFQFSV